MPGIVSENKFSNQIVASDKDAPNTITIASLFGSTCLADKQKEMNSKIHSKEGNFFIFTFIYVNTLNIRNSL
ncbi:MAG: hypothetical protein A2W86_06250 [Bacteroidetes bacterium GWD2_45_23]|nr:MAG: hypothetical protein A2W87_01030 [Bacteroidetes bacterium GWC2_46_850]OFX81853.1 MAG: hypothetical protein A2071_00955 [Bacteroidetes bacterium GWC1_47_7]OFX82883.1 MAG: hypothetical protein A2W86_06250 [Bacteroidetes bacterium GWD2_45_23]HBA99990.1 hypothetical protein [Porphyromonadaceae bacterium]HCC17919.1 hypothetical protein [Porphyromonadaceae bacterium]